MGERLGRLIAEARKKARLSQEDASALIGVSRPQLANIETGRGLPGMETACRIFTELRVDGNDLLRAVRLDLMDGSPSSMRPRKPGCRGR